jgi:hypothetical protein
MREEKTAARALAQLQDRHQQLIQRRDILLEDDHKNGNAKSTV